MSGIDYEGQRRAQVGSTIERCDLCGLATPESQLSDIESVSSLAEHDHPLRACPSCMERIFRGEIDVESIVIEEDMRRGREREI